MQEQGQGAPTCSKESAQYKKLSFDFQLVLLAIWISPLISSRTFDWKSTPIFYYPDMHITVFDSAKVASVWCVTGSVCVTSLVGSSLIKADLVISSKDPFLLRRIHHWIHHTWSSVLEQPLILNIWPNLLIFSWMGKLIYYHISIWDVTVIILANRGNRKCGELLQTVITQRSNLIRGWWHITWHSPGRSLVIWDNTGFLLAEITNDPSAPTRGTAWHWIPITRTKLFQITTLWPLSDFESDWSQDDGSWSIDNELVTWWEQSEN